MEQLLRAFGYEFLIHQLLQGFTVLQTSFCLIRQKAAGPQGFRGVIRWVILILKPQDWIDAKSSATLENSNWQVALLSGPISKSLHIP